MAVQGVKMSDLQDLVNTTLPHLPDLRFHHTQRLQKYEALDRWFAEDREEIVGGNKIKENIRLTETGQAQHVRPYQEDEVVIGETQHQFEADWVAANTHFALHRREMLANRGDEQFVDLLQSRKVDAMMSLAEELEYWAWRKPTGTDDDLHPFGIQYHIPKMDASHAGMGFFGGSGLSGTNSVMGINPGTSNHNQPNISGGEPRWRSFCAGGYDTTNGKEFYKEVNDALVRTMMLTYEAIHFESPMTARQLVEGFQSMFRLYTNMYVRTDLAQLQAGKNDQVGPEIGRFQGLLSFRRVPILTAPALNSDSSNPIYFVNHSSFVPYVRQGEYLRPSEAIRPSNHHNLLVTWIDLEYQFMCLNRAHNAVISLTTDYDTSGYSNNGEQLVLAQ